MPLPVCRVLEFHEFLGRSFDRSCSLGLVGPSVGLGWSLIIYWVGHWSVDSQDDSVTGNQWPAASDKTEGDTCSDQCSARVWLLVIALGFGLVFRASVWARGAES